MNIVKEHFFFFKSSEEQKMSVKAEKGSGQK